MTFAESYRTLNEAQRRAVDAIEGPCMVIAGPGTGKTQILTLRIANILNRTDTEPENILALTFTEAAAHNMRVRLAALIGNPAYRVIISTFHGFCNDVIRRFPEHFPRIVGSKPITDVDAVSMIEEIIEDDSPNPDTGESKSLVLLKPYGDRLLYVRDIISAIGELKRQGVNAEQFSALVAREKEHFEGIEDRYHTKGPHQGKMKGDYIKLERKILKNEELAIVYAHYQLLLTKRKGYDFSDMILEVLNAMQTDPTLLQLLQEEHQYVLVDEHQDTNNAQNKILELLMSYHDTPNLFMVGDEKQAIFRFQGASMDNFHYFKSRFKHVELIILTENYRSTQTVLTAAESLLPSETGLRKNAPHREAPIQIAALSTPASERYFVAQHIKETIGSGVPPEEIAILYRNNATAFAIARDLSRLGIPHQIESDQDLFTQRDVTKLLIILRAIAQYGNDLSVTELLHLSLFRIDPLDAYKLLRNANDRKKYTLYDLLTDEKLLEDISLSDTAGIVALGQKLTTWVKESRERDLLGFFEHIVRESGLLGEMLGAPDASERFDAINALFDQVRQLVERKSDASLADFFLYLETVRKHKLFIRRQSHTPGHGNVRLMTVHKSKGLEFAHVYIINAVNGIFGGKVDRDRLPLIDSVYRLEDTATDSIPDTDGDERRLFYVALTRAKESVTITYAAEDETHRETLPSEFIGEIKPELKNDVDASEWESRFQNDRRFQFSDFPKSGPGTTGERKDVVQFVNELFERQGLSPTALNNYLECPWKFFYVNLIRIPTVQSKHQCYGIAIHGALKDFFDAMKREPMEGEQAKAYLLGAFEHWINRVPLAPADFSESKAKGERALPAWFYACNGTWNLHIQTEYRINGVEFAPGIKLTGVLDKIEWNDDDTVTVVDYKTGKPRTRNELAGKTKSADGNYYRQLTFYKLLLQHFKDGQYVMTEGVIDFIEPDDKEKCHKEAFVITDDDVAGLTETILRVSDEIRNLTFWDRHCDEKSCEYCAMRRVATDDTVSA